MIEEERLYRVEEDWKPLFNETDQRLFCHRIEDGQSHYHRITVGELYLHKGTENFCLGCAKKKGIVTGRRPALAEAGYLEPVAPPVAENPFGIV